MPLLNNSNNKYLKVKVKSKILLYDILARINRHETIDEIRKWYGWSRQRLYYYIDKLKKADIIRLKVRDRISLYELTEKGKNFYNRHVSYLTSGIRLHNIEFIADIEGWIPSQEKEWKMNGLVNRLKRETNCTIIWNHQNIRFLVSSLFGKDAFSLFEESKEIVKNIIKNLELEFGIKISGLKLNRKPHFAIKSPIAEEFSKSLELTTDDAKLDASEGYGEIDYFTPEGADSFIKMPSRIAQLEEHLVKQTEIMDELSDNIKLHLEVMNEMKKTLKAIQEGLKK